MLYGSSLTTVLKVAVVRLGKEKMSVEEQNRANTRGRGEISGGSSQRKREVPKPPLLGIYAELQSGPAGYSRRHFTRGTLSR